jgi:hypothetical protein
LNQCAAWSARTAGVAVKGTLRRSFLDGASGEVGSRSGYRAARHVTPYGILLCVIT